LPRRAGRATDPTAIGYSARRHAPAQNMQEREEVRKLRVLRLQQRAKKYRAVVASKGRA